MGRLIVVSQGPEILLNVAGGGPKLGLFNLPYYNSRYDPSFGPPPKSYGETYYIWDRGGARNRWAIEGPPPPKVA